jgi:hypothetical protein
MDLHHLIDSVRDLLSTRAGQGALFGLLAALHQGIKPLFHRVSSGDSLAWLLNQLDRRSKNRELL